MHEKMNSVSTVKEEEGLIAVIVGIDGYKKRPLHCAVNDAVYLTETLKKVWKGRKTHIKTLLWPSLNETSIETFGKDQTETSENEYPKDAGHVSADGILSVVRQYANLAGDSDTFIFYFAGHGVLTDQEPAVVTIADAIHAEGTEYLKIKEIQQAAADSASQKKVMILDCCQSPTRRHKGAERYKNLEELSRGWSILLSSSPGEVSLEDQYFGDSRDDYLQQGVFTASLVEGLRGEAQGSSGFVSLADLAYFVGKRVPIEYQERIKLLLSRLARKNIQQPTSPRGNGLSSQNPVLLSNIVAMGGAYMIVMAPEFVPAAANARKKWPGKHFMQKWFKFIWGQWPIQFPFKPAFYFAALLYATTMTFTVLIYNLKPIDNTILLFLFGTALGSVLIWWIILPFVVAANENQWYPGGYIASFFYMLWHILVAISFSRVCDGQHSISGDHNYFIYLIIDLFYIFVGVVVFGCNSSQVITTLAETIRTDERREIRQAIRAFQQFKFKILGVDLYNFIPMITIRPDLYIYFGAFAGAVIIFNTYQVMLSGEITIARSLIIGTRNVSAFIFVTWLVFWYQSAFKFIQRQVYKR